MQLKPASGYQPLAAGSQAGMDLKDLVFRRPECKCARIATATFHQDLMTQSGVNLSGFSSSNIGFFQPVSLAKGCWLKTLLNLAQRNDENEK